MRHRDSRPYRRSDWRSFILPGVLGVGVTVGIGALALNDPPRLLHVPQPAERPIHASKAAERRHEIPPPFPSPAEVEQRPRKQVVFTDANYTPKPAARSEEHTSELQSRENLVCRLLLEKKKK